MPRNFKQLTLDDRESIAIGIMRCQSLKKIAEHIGKHVASVAKEVKRHRIFVRGSYYAGNDCRYAKGCNKRHVCGDEVCPMYCYACTKDCHEFCDEYECDKCRSYDRSPYVCNHCENRRYCEDDKYFYDAKVANRKASELKTTSRTGIHLTDDELNAVNEIISYGINKGQPLSHILSAHEDDIIISERTAYRYIGMSLLDVRNIDLRRQARYKKRKKKKGETSVLTQKYRQGRSYQDFQNYLEGKSDYIVTEMDTVKGKQGAGKVMLTMMLRRNSVMLIFIMPDCKADSVIYWFDYLENGLGKDCFNRLFGLYLTDNGAEFKRVDELEQSASGDGTLRTSMYYCDPMQSGQKGRLEKNHEYIRYVIPKGTSLKPFTQDDMTLLMNHINSTRRPGLQNLSPYELIPDDDHDMHLLMKLLGLKFIEPNDVNLTKSLLNVD